MRAIVLFNLICQLFLASISSNLFAEESQKIQVLTTIKPITMLVYAITKDKAEVKQLIPDFTSAHDYSLKPSDLEKIDKAKVIFRIDEHMETLMNPIFALLPSTTKLVSLADDDNILLFPTSLEERGKKGHGHGHQHGNMDLHIWTSPQNAIEIAKIITKTMAELDEDNSKVYENNFKELKLKINRTAVAINEELFVLKKKDYVVFHNSWQYFQKSFSLKLPIIIAMKENITPGVKGIREVRQKIKTIKPTCLFSDPHVSESKIKTIIEGFIINETEIDVLASKFYPVNEDTYINWLKSVKDKILMCLN